MTKGRFVTVDLEDHTLELDLVTGSLRISWSGAQTFLTKEEARKTLDVLSAHQDVLGLTSTHVVSVEEQRAIDDAVEVLHIQLGRFPTRAEVRDHLHWSNKDWPKIQAVYNPEADVPLADSSLSELICTGLLGTSTRELLLGRDLVTHALVWDTWSRFRGSVAIGGMSNSGRTRTLCFYALQALLNGATVWVADPHFMKPDSLMHVLWPLGSRIRFAGAPNDILQMFDAFAQEMERRRIQGWDDPLVLFVDEWDGLLAHVTSDKEAKLVSTLRLCSQEMGETNITCLATLNNWLRIAGSTDVPLTDLFATFITHRADPEVVPVESWVNVAARLKKSEIFLHDKAGDDVHLAIPRTDHDAILLLKSRMEDEECK